MTIEVTIQYFDGCPHWQEAERLIRESVAEVGSRVHVYLEVVDTPERAERLSFRGSPTILMNGSDPFIDETVPIGLSCRLYATPQGVQGTPTRTQVIDALRGAKPPE